MTEYVGICEYDFNPDWKLEPEHVVEIKTFKADNLKKAIAMYKRLSWQAGRWGIEETRRDRLFEIVKEIPLNEEE